MAAAQLVRTKIATETEVASAFAVSQATLWRWAHDRETHDASAGPVSVELQVPLRPRRTAPAAQCTLSRLSLRKKPTKMPSTPRVRWIRLSSTTSYPDGMSPKNMGLAKATTPTTR